MITDYTREILRKQGGDPDSLPDNLITTHLKAIVKNMGNGGGSGGSGVDVTASVGQTIVVEEVDANGKPTKWKAAEYQPRTHWTGAKVLVPEHTFDAGISGSNMVVHGDIKLLGLTVGKTYTVVFDGVTYTCVAETGQVTQDGVNMLDIISIGNLGMFGGTDNGLPFILGDLPFYNNGTWMCLPYVYGEHTLSIVDNAGVYPIPVQYVTNAFPYYIEITGSGTADDLYVCAESVANVNAIYASGRPLVVRFTDAQHFTWHIPMVWGAVVSAGSMYYFYVKWAGSDISVKTFVLASQDDGTFAVSNKLSD